MKRFLVALAPLMLLALGCTPTSSTTAPTQTALKTGAGGATGGAATAGAGSKVTLTGDNTKITFVGTKPDGKHDGGFNKLMGTMTLISMQPGGKSVPKFKDLHVDIETESLFSDTPKLTTHLKSNDFFDVAKFPKATFTSTSTELVETVNDKETIKVKGELTLRGVKKPLDFSVTVVSHVRGIYVTGTFELSRKDFGMTYGAGKVDDKVTVSVVVGQPEK